MKLFAIVTTIIIGIIFSNCKRSNPVKIGEILTIDILESIKNEGELNLSDIVDEVEIIELDSTPNAYHSNSIGLHVSDNFIICATRHPIYGPKVMLFNRSGKLLRLIGRIGKGPGEFTSIDGVAIDPTEEYILIIQARPKIISLYTVDGEYIRSKHIDDVPFYTVHGVHFIDQNKFAVGFSRPGGTNDEIFGRVVVFDLQLNVVHRHLPINDPDDLSMYLLQYIWFQPSEKGLFYCEALNDTAYYINSKNQIEARYHFNITENRVEESTFRNYVMGQDRNLGKNFIWSVYDLPNHILIYGTDTEKKTFLVCYNKELDEAFSCQYRDPCYIGEQENRPYIKNDLFGLEPIYLRSIQPQDGIMVMDFKPSERQLDLDINCFKDLDVLDHVTRDRIMKMIQQASGNENKVLLVLHLKK